MIDHSDPVAVAAVSHRFGPGGAPPLNDEQVKRCVSIRESCRLLAMHLLHSVPPSWERDKALEHLDDTCSYAVRSISRNEGRF